MSGSRSPLPPYPLSPTNPLDPTPSRPLKDDSPSFQTPEILQQDLISRPIPPPSGQPREATTSRSSNFHPRADSPVPQPPMAKRLRRDSPVPRPRSRAASSPSSDSQDGMADTEMDNSQGQQSETQPTLTAPPKKKRTRTLTTPHQSAVLHALLAQSRFPTTAMREEVGRSIGLSARKVQIWFQNQRQKARRPRSPSDASRNRPPLYGPFSSNTDSVSVNAFPTLSEATMAAGRLDYDDRTRSDDQYPPQRPSDAFPGPMETLLGPGMPGSESRASTGFRGRPPTSPQYGRPSTSRNFTMQPYGTRQYRHRSPSPRNAYPVIRPTSAHTYSSSGREFSRTLPPLSFSDHPGEPSSSHLRSFSRTSSSFVTPFGFHRSTSPDPTFAHHPPELSTPTSAVFPPPFTLQPNPQWDTSSLPSALRPGSSPWSRPSSRATVEGIPLASPVTFRRDSAAPDTPGIAHTRRDSPAPSRGRRYDPVRSIFVSPTGPDPSPATTSQQPSSQAPDESLRPTLEDPTN